jgi:hypothetical protein
VTAQLDRGVAALRIKFAKEIANGDIVHLGRQGNCRRKNNTATGPYSEHAWPGGNAVDVMLRNWSGRKALGDRIAAWMRANKALWSEVFWQVAAHYDHVHGTATPRMNYDNKQIPPCAGGAPISLGDDEMFPLCQYGHGYKTPPKDSGLVGDQTAHYQHVVYCQNLLGRAGWKGTIDGVYGGDTIAGVITYGASKDGKVISGWVLDNIQAQAFKSGGGGMTAAQVQAVVDAAVKKHAANPDAHHA